MSRIARLISDTGYYHVVNRGVGRQNIFMVNHDRVVFLKLLDRIIREENCVLIAYCLMDNHVHLLIRTEHGLERPMHRIFTNYALYYNKKYLRSGHLFQGRFRSEPIMDDCQLLAAVRYIHNNPQKAGICRREDYFWSSWKEYWNTGTLIDPAIVLKMCGGKEGFLAFSRIDSDDQFLEISNAAIWTDQTAAEMICQMFSLRNASELQGMEMHARLRALRKIKSKGISIRQIERLTGINRGTISRA